MVQGELGPTIGFLNCIASSLVVMNVSFHGEKAETICEGNAELERKLVNFFENSPCARVHSRLEDMGVIRP